MAPLRAVLLLSLLAAWAHGLREVSLRHGRNSQAPEIPKYKVGDFMQYQVLEGPDAGSWVKCSITGLGELPDTYNLYVWSADPHRRHLTNIPVEVLRSQVEQDVKQFIIDAITAEEEKKRLAKEAEERKRREEEAAVERAKELLAEKKRQAAEAIRLAKEEKARLLAEEEAKKKAEEEARLAAEREEQERLERAEEARKRKIYLKAKWEQVKAMKKQKELEAEEEEKKHLAEEAERRAMAGKNGGTTTPRPLADPENIKVVIKFEDHPDLVLKVKRNLRLRMMMSLATERMGVPFDSVRFSIGKKVYSPDETAERFGRHDKTVVRMEKISPHERAAQLRLKTGATDHAGARSFEAGDFVEASISTGRDSGSVPCTVLRHGRKKDTFDIHFIFPTGGAQDLQNFPANLLTKVRGKEYAAAVKTFRENPTMAANMVNRLANQALPVEPTAPGTKEAGPVETGFEGIQEEEEQADSGFELHNLVEFTLQDGTKVPATVINTDKRDSNLYDLRVLFAVDSELRNLRDIPAVSGDHLRKLPAKDYVEAVHRLKKDQSEAQRVLEMAAQEVANSGTAWS